MERVFCSHLKTDGLLRISDISVQFPVFFFFNLHICHRNLVSSVFLVQFVDHRRRFQLIILYFCCIFHHFWSGGKTAAILKFVCYLRNSTSFYVFDQEQYRRRGHHQIREVPFSLFYIIIITSLTFIIVCVKYYQTKQRSSAVIV